jgi:gentisate 1,2-dioxygenase
MTGEKRQNAFSSATTLDDLYDKLQTMNIRPGWSKSNPSLWPAPRKPFQPVHWSYVEAKEALDAAGRLMDITQAERRNLIMFNPGEQGTYGTLKTLVAAYQMALPGERAPSHRHVPNALRLIVDAGEGAYTVVNGKKIIIRRGDVVLTPNWHWHEHGNESHAPAYWLDFLDVPLVQLLGPMFFERNPEEFEKKQELVEDSSLMFSWRAIEPKLTQAPTDANGVFGKQIELGRPAMETIALHMMLLPPNQEMKPYQTTANTIYAVVKGSGTTIAEGTSFEWERGDVIAIPSWYEHSHRGKKEAVLLRVTDEPAMNKLGFLRTAVAR